MIARREFVSATAIALTMPGLASAKDKPMPMHITVPVAMLMSDKDFFPTPREWAARSYDIARLTQIQKGGHLLEQEEPERVAADLRSFFATVG